MNSAALPAPHPPTRWRWRWPRPGLLLLLLAMLALLPVYAAPTRLAPGLSYSYLFVLDVTQSMNVRDQGRDAAPQSRLDAAKQALVDYVPGAEQAPVVVELAAVSEAIAAHRAAAASRAKNLLVPKPKAAETSKARPGQRQRKPMPARRKR